MADFNTSTELEVAVSSQSLSGARNTIESELGDITVDVEGSADSRAVAGGGGGMGISGAMGAGIADFQEQQVDLLESIDESLEGTAGLGLAGLGGGGGGLLASGQDVGEATAGAGLFQAIRNLSLSSLLSSAALSGAMTPGSPLFFGAGGANIEEQLQDFREFQQGEGEDPTGPILSTLMDAVAPLQLVEGGFDLFSGAGEGAGEQIDTPGDRMEDQLQINTGEFFDAIGQFNDVTTTFLNQSPQWLGELEALLPPAQPRGLPEDPSEFGRPAGVTREDFRRRQGSDTTGEAVAAGRERQLEANVTVDVTEDITLEDNRDLERQMDRLKTETIREIEREIRGEQLRTEF